MTPNPSLRPDAQPADTDVANLLNRLILEAIQAKASDIHIEPWEEGVVVRIRVDGVLRPIARLAREIMDRISGRLKVAANLVSYQTWTPQEGHIPASPELDNVDLRLSIFPTVRGEKIVIRLFDPRSRSFDLGTLGFDLPALRSFVELLTRPTGLILLTGPTGSGKTTAIYAALTHLVHRSGPAISISTVEDPVEFHLPSISQTQVNPAREFTYPIALRSLLRQDPQIIMIGEIRDGETASIAVQAGLTGHLVISTIHSGTTAGVFARLVQMEVEPFLLASSITGVLGLRLTRTNCRLCSEPYQPAPELLRLLPTGWTDTAYFRRGAGCSACQGTGFDGRAALTELLVVNERIRETVLAKVPTRTLQEVAEATGMTTLASSGLARVARGETTLEELARVVALGAS
jgi:type II secretory ATPase GspE/PulE/Tfp pilus assembly ATPase PilB-like protein